MCNLNARQLMEILKRIHRERQRAEKFAQRLLKMGVSPDDIDKIISSD